MRPGIFGGGGGDLGCPVVSWGVLGVIRLTHST